MLSAQKIARVERLFQELNWNRGELLVQDTFERFCGMLELLGDPEQEMLFELSRRYLWITQAAYRGEIAKAFALIPQIRLGRYNKIKLFPLVRSRDANQSKSAQFLAYLLKSSRVLSKPPFSNFPVVLDATISCKVVAKAPPDTLNILIDDYVGSGETADNACEEFRTNTGAVRKDQMVLAIVAQEQGIARLRGLGIDAYCSHLRNKGIADNFVGQQLRDFIAMMQAIETRIQVPAAYRFGYAASEALVSMERTPNNTFPIYWLKSIVSPFTR